MAEAGGGNFHFAERATQLSDFIAGETNEALAYSRLDSDLFLASGVF